MFVTQFFSRANIILPYTLGKGIRLNVFIPIHIYLIADLSYSCYSSCYILRSSESRIFGSCELSPISDFGKRILNSQRNRRKANSDKFRRIPTNLWIRNQEKLVNKLKGLVGIFLDLSEVLYDNIDFRWFKQEKLSVPQACFVSFVFPRPAFPPSS